MSARRRIAVFTGSRAEYGLLYWLMRGIADSAALELQVVAGCMHFSPEFGETWRDIEADGFAIAARVEMLLSSDSRAGVVKSLGVGLIGLADVLDRLAPDALVVLGDRFEALAAAQAALIMGSPLVHIHGGELTEGAYDDAIRHAITKMASLHFTAASPYRDRVIQMGEEPDRVFCVGALGLDHLSQAEPIAWADVCTSLGRKLERRVVLATYHPATNADEDPAATARAMLAALENLDDCDVILTYPNADNGGHAIIAEIEAFGARHPEKTVIVPSLGFRRYVAVLRKAAIVIGNSSSGIIEAPSFGIPTVDIGSRQKGRLAAPSVLHCAANETSIREALEQALSPEHLELSREAENPYGAGSASRHIVKVLEEVDLSTHKRFHDLELPR
jgi:UDP-N-acetylglucosamine 2-epimerase (non-hydrolysing)